MVYRSRSEREKHRGSGFSLGFVKDLWFDDVIYGFWVYDWVFSRVFDDLWFDWCYVVLLLMLDDLDVLSLIWLGFDLLSLRLLLSKWLFFCIPIFLFFDPVHVSIIFWS